MMKQVLGLDLGSHSLKAVELQQTFRGLEPVQFRIQPRTDDIPLGEQLRDLIHVNQLPTDQVCCALPSDVLTLHRLEFPFRDHKRLGQTIPFELEGRIPFELEDILIDWEIVASENKQATVAAVLAQRRDIARLLGDLADAEIDPRILEAEGMVLGNLSPTFDLSGTRLLVDLGHSKTTLCLARDGQATSSRSIRVGGRHLTEAIASDLGWGVEDAERWKCEEGIFAEDLTSSSSAALEVLDRIAREIVRSLDSLEAKLGSPANSQLDAITLIGGGARLHRVSEYLTGRTGIATAPLGLPPVPEDAALVAGGDAVHFAPALALAFRATTRAKTRVNFRQEEFSYRTNFSQFFGKDLRPTAVLGGLAVLLAAGSAATSSVSENGRTEELNEQAAEIYRATFPGEAEPDNQVAAMSGAVQAARDRADFLGVYGGNRSALDLLTQLSRSIPADLAIEFEETTIDPKVIRIKASASTFDIPDRVVEKLKTEEVFTQVRVTGEIKKIKDRVVFNISIPLSDRGDRNE